MGDMYERFEVSDWDMENEFNPRRSRKLTKEQTIYGVFGDSDDDERPSYRNDKKSKSSGPIGFVSGGVAGSSKAETMPDYEDDDDEIKIEERPSSSGFQSNKKRRAEQQHQGFGFAGIRSTGNQGIGTWEKHTKGIGAKLLMKMGYEPGKGLGKNKQGITVPIEAKKREGTGAIGFYGKEHKQKALFAEDLKKKDEANEPQKNLPKTADGRKQIRDSKGKVRKTYVYKSVDEVLAEDLGGNFSVQDITSFTKVIDMRGPDQKVLAGYHEIGAQKICIPREGLTREQRGLHEIELNLNLLVDMTEQEIKRRNRNIKRENERLQYLEDERVFIKEKIFEQRRYVDIVENAISSISDLKTSFDNGTLRSFAVQDFCCSFLKTFPDGCALIDLSEIVVSMAFPVLAKELSNWSAIAEPRQPFDLIQNWRSVLIKVDEKLYDSLIWDTWMSKVRRELMQWPSLKQCDDIILFLELWKPVLPNWVVYNIMSQIIIPRLEREVEEWNPLVDPVPIHSWIHPWLPVSGDASLEDVFALIRHKLSAALIHWHPSDLSAKVILTPWKGVFTQQAWDTFLGSSIVPKLEAAMQAFVISPHHQQGFETWVWIMAWEDMIPVTTISSILEKNFFPKWLDTLYHWLGHSPNYEEVGKWYLGWKGMLKPELADQPIIKNFLQRALEMMDYAVTSPNGISSYRYGPSVVTPHTAEQIRLRREILSQASTPASSSSALNFKQLITKEADDNGILFMPVPNRTFENKQIYQFGKVKIYLDRTVIFVQNSHNNAWSPVSLQTLIDSAH